MKLHTQNARKAQIVNTVKDDWNKCLAKTPR